MANLRDVKNFIADHGTVAVRHEWYDRHGLRQTPYTQEAVVPVVDFISEGDVFAYLSPSDGQPHAVWVDKVTRGTDEFELRAAPDEGTGDLLVLRVQPPTPQHRDEAKVWIDMRDEAEVGAELKELHRDLSENKPAKPKLGPSREYTVLLAHAMRNDTGELHTAAAIAYGHGEIVAVPYAGTEDVADMWNERFRIATAKPEEIIDHYLERSNGITEELSPRFKARGVSAADAARATLAETNTRRGMVINV